MPSFDDIREEAHRIAVEERYGAIAYAISAGKPVHLWDQKMYEAIIDRAYATLVEREKQINDLSK